MVAKRFDYFMAFFRTGTMRKVGLLALLAAAYSGFAVWKESTVFAEFGDHPSGIYLSLSMILGLLLVLRTNTAYDRWWEARKLWGKLVNVSRNLTVKSRVLANVEHREVELMARDISDFSHVLRDHLRGEYTQGSVAGRNRDSVAFEHLPDFVAIQIFQRLQTWRETGAISDDVLRVLDSESREFLEICGACERILKTPLSRSYRLFLRQIVVLFLLTLPWGLVNDIGGWTILLTFVEAYLLIGVEVIGESIEEPFGREVDDLDLDEICETITRTVTEIATQPA